MRFLHTADWHLGRTLGGFSLREEQAHMLGVEFPRLVRETRPDAVLLAGDVFDRAVPPAEAVELLDDILHRVVVDLGVPVVMIPGNHDDPRRLAFGARMLAAAGLHIGDSPLGRVIRLADAHGEVAIVAAGYASPLALAQQAAGADFADHDAAFAWLAPQLQTLCTTRCTTLCTPTRRRVLVAHAFVAGGTESESERQISVGGTGQIAAHRVAGFDYVALGHLHRPQALAGGRIRYSGSPLAYSSSEAGQLDCTKRSRNSCGGAGGRGGWVVSADHPTECKEPTAEAADSGPARAAGCKHAAGPSAKGEGGIGAPT
jgi:exonuclease SbcD